MRMLSPKLRERISALVNAPLIRQVPFLPRRRPRYTYHYRRCYIHRYGPPLHPRQVPFFHGAAPRCVTEVMLAMLPRLYSPREVIIHAGEMGNEMYIIKSGEVQVKVLLPEGIKPLPLHLPLHPSLHPP